MTVLKQKCCGDGIARIYRAFYHALGVVPNLA